MAEVVAVVSGHDAGTDFEIDLTPGFVPPVRCVRPDEDVANEPLVPRRPTDDRTEQPVEELPVEEMRLHSEVKRRWVFAKVPNAIARSDVQIILRREPQDGANVRDDGHGIRRTTRISCRAGLADRIVRKQRCRPVNGIRWFGDDCYPKATPGLRLAVFTSPAMGQFSRPSWVPPSHA